MGNGRTSYLEKLSPARIIFTLRISGTGKKAGRKIPVEAGRRYRNWFKDN